MISRRSLLKGGAALLLPFTMAGKALGILGKQAYYSPYYKGLGKALKVEFETQYNLEPMFEHSFRRYVALPLEAIVTVTYEKGEEVWSAFNCRNEDIKAFSLPSFLGSPFVNGQDDYGGHIDYRGKKFKLSSVRVTDEDMINERWETAYIT